MAANELVTTAPSGPDSGGGSVAAGRRAGRVEATPGASGERGAREDGGGRDGLGADDERGAREDAGGGLGSDDERGTRSEGGADRRENGASSSMPSTIE